MAFISSFSINKKDVLVSLVKKKLRSAGIKLTKITVEESCIILHVTSPVDAVDEIQNLAGIQRVGIANVVANKFKDIVHEIVEIGRISILPKQIFSIKVNVSADARVDFVARDVEFAAYGSLTGDLSKIQAHPAKNDSNPDKVIFVYVGKKSTYVCKYLIDALGGVPSGSSNISAMGAVYSPLSAVSLLMSAKCGILYEFLIPYTDQKNLIQSLNTLQSVATYLPNSKPVVHLAKIELPKTTDQWLQMMLLDNISSNILMAGSTKHLIFQHCGAIHPSWLIESLVQDCVSRKKMPWFPLMLMTDEVYICANNLGLGDKLVDQIDMAIRNLNFNLKDYKKHLPLINSASKKAIENLKTLSVKIGPNYIHDVIDSI